MIRVDHHPHSNSNLKQSPADLLSWDDADFLSDAIVKPLSHPDDMPLVDEKPGESTTTEVDADADTDPISSQDAPTREDDGSSSLSPVPPTNPLAEEKEAPIEIPQREEEEEDEGEGSVVDKEEPAPTVEPTANASSSRQSTPLSELSSPPDEDDAEGAPDPSADAMDVPAAETNGVSPPPPSTTTTSVGPTSPPPVSVSSPSISIPSAADFSTSIGMMATNPAMHDPKVVSILELNVEMFK
jgi:hypothetical protein